MRGAAGAAAGALPYLKTEATPAARPLKTRYVAGKLTWVDIRRALNAA